MNIHNRGFGLTLVVALFALILTSGSAYFYIQNKHEPQHLDLSGFKAATSTEVSGQTQKIDDTPFLSVTDNLPVLNQGGPVGGCYFRKDNKIFFFDPRGVKIETEAEAAQYMKPVASADTSSFIDLTVYYNCFGKDRQ